jgi:hypothetical protein
MNGWNARTGLEIGSGKGQAHGSTRMEDGARKMHDCRAARIWRGPSRIGHPPLAEGF